MDVGKHSTLLQNAKVEMNLQPKVQTVVDCDRISWCATLEAASGQLIHSHISQI